MLPMILIIFVMFFFMNRSEKKRRAELEDKLKKGDRVLTRSGFIGKLVDIGETRAKVELAPGVVVPIVKTAIEGLADADDSSGKGADKGKGKGSDAGDADDKKKKKK
jgi:preprotein translocase subunit YajC